MLESISCRNFQNHRSRVIELDPLVTCIVGPSAAGKSAILRLLRWIVLNRPQGDSFIRHGKKGAVGELVVDGIKIVRKKGKGVNSYGLERIHGDASALSEEKLDSVVQIPQGRKGTCEGLQSDDLDRKRRFKAFGTEPPEAVRKILNVAEESFQRQLDAPFFFSLTPGQAAKELNSVIDLEVIDRTLSKLAAGQRKAKMELDVGRQRYSDSEAKAKELAWVEAMDADLKGVERAEEVYNRTQEKASALRETIGGAEKVRQERLDAAQAAVDGLGAFQTGEAWHKKAKRAADLGQLLFRLGKLEGERCEVEAKIEEASKKTSRYKACPLCGQATR